MLDEQIRGFHNRLDRAAHDTLSADAEVLMNLAADIVRAVGESEDSALAPTDLERRMLCQVAVQLLSGEAQHARISWRMSAAQTALITLEQLIAARDHAKG